VGCKTLTEYLCCVTHVVSCLLFAVNSDAYMEPLKLSPELAEIMGEPQVSIVSGEFELLTE